ncbi:MAG: histidine phosphatase family protein [Rhodospirillales bacterium]|nr:histidine phosphatase family protein [Rhodospirillales bacterium]
MTDQKAPSKKHLYLLRHAKAIPAAESKCEDIERVLAPRGHEDAKALAGVMKRKGYLPEYALCSPATRTKQTLDPIEDVIDIPEKSCPKILYTGPVGGLLGELQKVSPSFDRVILVGHNPDIWDLAKILSGSGGASLVQRLKERYKPGAISVLTFGGDDWADLRPGCAELVDYMDPLDYNAPSTPARWT